MALQIHSSPSASSLVTKPYQWPHLLLLSPVTKPNKFEIKSQKPTEQQPTDNSTKQATTVTSSGVGFGSQSSSTNKTTGGTGSKTKEKGNRRERASIIRRKPVETPTFISQENEAKVTEQSQNESAFLLAWLGLGGFILVEGIVLAASGFLPEKWDKFFVKYLYPSFTPTVGLFVAGTVAYGVLKYLQNEKLKDQK